MHKKLFLTVIISLFIIMLTACGEQNNPEQVVNTGSTTASTYKQTDVTDNIVSDAQKDTSVVETRKEDLGAFYNNPITVETLDNGVEISKDKKGNIISMTFPEEETKGEPVGEDKIEGIAREFIRANLTENVDKYEVTNLSYSEFGGYFLCDFGRDYQGYPGEEWISVDIYADGTIKGYIARCVDIFENINIPTIDRTAIEQKVENKITKEKNAESYEITNMVLVYSLNQKLQMYVAVDLSRTDGTTSNTVYYIDIE